MSTTIGRLKETFLYKYHRLPGYLQAKRERMAARAKVARWKVEETWRHTVHPSQPLSGKSRKEIEQILFRDLIESTTADEVHAAPELVEDHHGFNIFALEGRYFGLKREAGMLDAESLRANEYDPCLVAHTLPDVREEIDRFINRSETSNHTENSSQRVLFIGNVAPDRARAFLERLRQHDVTILSTRGLHPDWQGYETIGYFDAAGNESPAIDLNNTSAELLETLRQRKFDFVAAPYLGRTYWNSFNIEMFVPAFSNRLVTMFEDGRTRSYQGEDLNRITYNKAYLNDMFRFVPPVKGKRVLEVGCSDGLACDLLLSEEPDAVVGIDCMEAVGCSYRDPKINYFKMDASRLRFKDRVFHVAYSLATLEHVPDPFAVMQEMRRVTRAGGYCVIQAGPLYHSPFGHHMFGFFDEFPWIHLRLSKDEIVDYARSTGADRRIEQAHGVSAAEYVDRMLRPEHINGLTVKQYRLGEFMALPNVKVLNLAKNYEGQDALTGEVRDSLAAYGEEDLTTSGFELIVKIR
jgi:SAM-dependent methyltransferase